MKKWKLRIGGGLFKGNESAGLVIRICDPMYDYPKGIMCFYVLSMQFLRFEIWIVLDKVSMTKE